MKEALKLFCVLTTIFLFDSCVDYIQIVRGNTGPTKICHNLTNSNWGNQAIAIGSYKVVFRTNVHNKKWVNGKGFQIYSLCFNNTRKSSSYILYQ